MAVRGVVSKRRGNEKALFLERNRAFGSCAEGMSCRLYARAEWRTGGKGRKRPPWAKSARWGMIERFFFEKEKMI